MQPPTGSNDHHPLFTEHQKPLSNSTLSTEAELIPTTSFLPMPNKRKREFEGTDPANQRAQGNRSEANMNQAVPGSECVNEKQEGEPPKVVGVSFMK